MTTPSSNGLSGTLQFRLFLAALLMLTLAGAGVIWLEYSGELERAKRLMDEDLRARAVSLEQSLHVVQAATDALSNEIQQLPGGVDPAISTARMLRMAFNSRGTSDISKLVYLRNGTPICAQEGLGKCGGWIAQAFKDQPGLTEGNWSEPVQDEDSGWIVAHVMPVPGYSSAWVAAEIRLSSLQKYTFAVHSLDSVVSIVDSDGRIVTNGDSSLPSGAALPGLPRLDRAGDVVRAGGNFVALEHIAGPNWTLVATIPAASVTQEATAAVLPVIFIVVAILLVSWGGAVFVEIRALRPARAAGQKLAQTLSNLEVTFASVSDGIALLDKDRRLIASNRRFGILLGLRGGADVPGLPEAMMPSEHDGVLAADGTWSFDFLNSDARWVEVRLRDWQSGTGSGLVAVLTDITDRREATEKLTAAKQQAEEALETLQSAQTRLVEAEKLAALGELVAGVAHEINTPIGVAMSAATSLVDQTRSFVREIEAGTLRRSTVDNFKGMLTETAGMVERNIVRAADLIRQFKQVAIDRTSHQRRRFDLRQVVDETVGTLYPALKRTNYRIEVDIPAGLSMDGFPGPLGQIVTNLVTNALAHAFDGRHDGLILLSGRMIEDEQVELICRDDGIGMPPSVQRRIFEPFFTTKRGQGGSGLGMHIIYTLVTGLMGGLIEVVSQPDQGTEIRMTLPAHAPETSPDADQRIGYEHAQ